MAAGRKSVLRRAQVAWIGVLLLGGAPQAVLAQDGLPAGPTGDAVAPAEQPEGADDAVAPAAQPEDTDAAARESFLLGRAAYRGADYEQALRHFRRAHELSGRNQLLYNIGISADRFGNDEEALEAFERYLAENDNPARDQEVRERIAFLRLAIAERSERERLVAEAATHDAAVNRDVVSSTRRMPKSAIVGGSVLAAVGVAGITTMGLGLSRNGSCLEEGLSGVCVTERTASPWTGVYGALGVAALAGSVTWFVVSSRRAKRERSTAWMLSPTGVTVAGSF